MNMEKKLINEISRMKMIMGIPSHNSKNFINEASVSLESIEELLKNLVSNLTRPEVGKVEEVFNKVVKERPTPTSRESLFFGRGGKEIEGVLPAEFESLKNKIRRDQIDWDIKIGAENTQLVKDVKNIVKILKNDEQYVNQYYSNFMNNISNELTNQSQSVLGSYHDFTDAEVLEFIREYKNSKQFDVKTTLENLSGNDVFFSELLNEKISTELKNSIKKKVEESFTKFDILVEPKTIEKLKTIDLKNFGGPIDKNADFLKELNTRCNNYPDLRKVVSKVIYQNLSKEEKNILTSFEEQLISAIKQKDLTEEEVKELINKFIDDRKISTYNFPSFDSELKKYIFFDVTQGLKKVTESLTDVSSIFDNLGTKFFTNQIESSELSLTQKALASKYIPATVLRAAGLWTGFETKLLRESLDNWNSFLEDVYELLKGYVEKDALSSKVDDKLFYVIDSKLTKFKDGERQSVESLKAFLIKSLKEAKDVEGKTLPPDILTLIENQLKSQTFEKFTQEKFFKVLWNESYSAKAISGIRDANIKATDKFFNLLERGFMKLFFGQIWKVEEYLTYIKKKGWKKGLLAIWAILSVVSKVVVPTLWGITSGFIYATNVAIRKTILDTSLTRSLYDDYIKKHPLGWSQTIVLKLKSELISQTHTFLYKAGYLTGPGGSTLDMAISLLNPFTFPVYYGQKWSETGHLEGLDEESMRIAYENGRNIETAVKDSTGITKQQFNDSVRTGDLTKLNPQNNSQGTGQQMTLTKNNFSFEQIKKMFPCTEGKTEESDVDTTNKTFMVLYNDKKYKVGACPNYSDNSPTWCWYGTETGKISTTEFKCT